MSQRVSQEKLGYVRVTNNPPNLRGFTTYIGCFSSALSVQCVFSGGSALIITKGSRLTGASLPCVFPGAPCPGSGGAALSGTEI